MGWVFTWYNWYMSTTARENVDSNRHAYGFLCGALALVAAAAWAILLHAYFFGSGWLYQTRHALTTQLAVIFALALLAGAFLFAVLCALEVFVRPKDEHTPTKENSLSSVRWNLIMGAICGIFEIILIIYWRSLGHKGLTPSVLATWAASYWTAALFYYSRARRLSGRARDNDR